MASTPATTASFRAIWRVDGSSTGSVVTACAVIGAQTPAGDPHLASVMPPTWTLNFQTHQIILMYCARARDPHGAPWRASTAAFSAARGAPPAVAAAERACAQRSAGRWARRGRGG